MKLGEWLEMVRFRNCLASMSEDPLSRIIYKWDTSLDMHAWAKSVHFVLQYVNMLNVNVNESAEEDMDDVLEDEPELKHVHHDVAKSRLMRIN